MRKVIQITSEGVHLCDDGTMWTKVDASTSDETSTIWNQLDNVPQSEDGSSKPPKPPKPPECRIVIDGKGGVQNKRDFTEQPPNTEYVRGR